MILSGTQLKLIAALIMVVDHVGAVLFPQYIILRIIGRMSFPIFCFVMAEGMYYSKNIRGYLLRLFAVALITQPVYSLCFTGQLFWKQLNVMFTFLLAGIGILGYQRLPVAGKWLGIVGMFAAACLAAVLNTDYGDYGVALVSLFYLLRENKKVMVVVTGLFQLGMAQGIQQYSIFSLVPILFYNGKRGRNIKYFFYVFYPAHLLIIYIVGRCLEIYR